MKEKIYAAVPWLLAIIFGVLGAFGGAGYGDWAMDIAQYTRPDDVIKYTVGSPIIGGVIGIAVGLIVSAQIVPE